MLRNMAYAIRRPQPMDMTPRIKKMTAGAKEPKDDE